MHRSRRAVMTIAAAMIGMGVLHGAREAAAMRYVEINIRLDKRIVLRTSQGDSGHEDAATVWRYLRRLELRSMNGYRIKPDPGQPLRATLRGKLRIESNSESASVSQLRLVRAQPDGTWKVDPAEVERTFKLRKKDTVEEIAARYK